VLGVIIGPEENRDAEPRRFPDIMAADILKGTPDNGRIRKKIHIVKNAEFLDDAYLEGFPGFDIGKPPGCGPQLPGNRLGFIQMAGNYNALA
jgi:hypothetical protein